jgi:glutamyl-tRNA synthetase
LQRFRYRGFSNNDPHAFRPLADWLPAPWRRSYRTVFMGVCSKARCEKFVLRVEDTDQERSTLWNPKKAILDGLALGWVSTGMRAHFFRCSDLIATAMIAQQLLAEGKAYHCYASKEELDSMREAQRARGEKPRYDGRWRPEPGKTLPVATYRHSSRSSVSGHPRTGRSASTTMIKGRITGRQQRTRRLW